MSRFILDEVPFGAPIFKLRNSQIVGLSFGAITKCNSRKDFQPTEHINNSKKEPTVGKKVLLKYCSFFLNEEEIKKIISDALPKIEESAFKMYL